MVGSTSLIVCVVGPKGDSGVRGNSGKMGPPGKREILIL